MKMNEYQCTLCKGVFEKAWSEEEALTELGETFPGVGTDDCALVCDDCYKAIGLG